MLMILLSTHLLLSLTILNVIDFTFRFFMNDRPLVLVHTYRRLHAEHYILSGLSSLFDDKNGLFYFSVWIYFCVDISVGLTSKGEVENGFMMDHHYPGIRASAGR